MKTIELKVMEAISDDVHKGIVRINAPFIKELDLRPIDFVGIQGNRETFARAGMGYPGDIGTDIVRMDGIIRRNADVGIGDFVKIFKADSIPALKVVICPTDPNIIIRHDIEQSTYFKRKLDGRPLSNGDIFVIDAMSAPSKILESPIFSDVYKTLNANLDSLGLKDIKFKVLQVYPQSPGEVFFNTQFILKKAVKEVVKSRIGEYTERYMKPFERKLNSINDVEELEKLRDKVKNIKARVSPKVVRGLEKVKFRLMREIDKKISRLKKVDGFKLKH